MAEVVLQEHDLTLVRSAVTAKAVVLTFNTTSDVTASADIVSAGGSISIISSRNVTLLGTADLRTSAGGSIEVEAREGEIYQGADSVILSTGSAAAARLSAKTNITVGDIELAEGKVSITALTGSIFDADPLNGLTNDNDADVDVTSAQLRLWAGTAVGESVDHLETSVGRLSARAAGGGIWLLESNDLMIDDVTVTVNRVRADGSVVGSTLTDALQSDVRTTGANGSIVLRTVAGSVTLNDGTASADDTAVSAHGSGNVLISLPGLANGSSGAISIPRDGSVSRGLSRRQPISSM
ncbi:MAG: hypothetical protein EB027_07300 [Actinobacteria bacterium]|nr:hypothetical protein [Actinomycetota bacterium]